MKITDGTAVFEVKDARVSDKITPAVTMSGVRIFARPHHYSRTDRPVDAGKTKRHYPGVDDGQYRGRAVSDHRG